MSRPLRVEYPGAVYHVASRGQERGAIFRDDVDREIFLRILGSVVEDHGWLLHGYCLMTNHYHMLVETQSANLSVGMRALNGRYTQRFNQRHRRSGHLFEGRYKGVLVQKQAHLLELHRYVVLNPVRAGLVVSARDYAWSNYRATSGLSPGPAWLETDWTLGQFATRRRMAREQYRRFVAAGKGIRSPLQRVRGQIYLGDERFVRKAVSRAAELASDGEIPLAQRRPWAVSLEDVGRAVAKEFGVAAGRLARRRGGEDKIAAIYLARRLTGLTGKQIGVAFGVKPARVSNAVREVDEGQHQRLRPRIERLRLKLQNV